MLYYVHMGMVFFFIFGLIIGSFLNAVIYRLQSNESVACGRSRCFSCQHQLGFWDLIPVFSFIFLRARCRYCQQKISWQYPLVELATGGLFAWSYYYFFNNLIFSTVSSWYLVITLILISFCLIIFVYDLRYYLVADQIVWPIVIIMLLGNIFIFHLSLLSLFFTAAGLMLFFWLQIVISHGHWLGSGDILLGLLMGVSLGWPRGVIALLLAYWIGALIGLVLMLFKKKDLNSQIPFGPFLMLGLIITWFWGNQILTFIYG